MPIISAFLVSCRAQAHQVLANDHHQILPRELCWSFLPIPSLGRVRQRRRFRLHHPASHQLRRFRFLLP
jgi:hypothetical protein